jgi:hypothetical protein
MRGRVVGDSVAAAAAELSVAVLASLRRCQERSPNTKYEAPASTACARLGPRAFHSRELLTDRILGHYRSMVRER